MFETATRGVNGVLFTVFAAEALKVGITGLEAPFCLSLDGIELPLLELNGTPFCSARIMTLLSRDCRGIRCCRGSRDGVVWLVDC